MAHFLALLFPHWHQQCAALPQENIALSLLRSADGAVSPCQFYIQFTLPVWEHIGGEPIPPYGYVAIAGDVLF
jgi:hypothetical protein